MDAGDVFRVLLVLAAWRIFNVWNDTRIRYRCKARTDRGWPWCRTPVYRKGDRCNVHVSRRRRSLGP